ncbi:SusC/RagA family TonB-linked outer membrane protein [Pedobacter sp. MC2016-14]|uniref:SusC/RagA family TonB-linked outer membrane protein n=1 Tax=Pedobacter sp. MC2016-14 TaxID=2897327 RepID=UPI001E439237|nr:SusC/RagA family TonB-linked outer membrane protein [Pedobacter sp. MC2016-14]MCD0489339.1 SusC/RagA family TonB-linked outer membrane protein [Pedobacter sp. MC2016-14]
MNSKLLRKVKGIVLLSIFCCASAYAQQKKITGKVTDGGDGGPIPGVNVSIKGKPSNVSTNAQGVYVIQADPAVDVLVFSYIGFVRQTITLAGRATVDVKLASDNQTLTQVDIVSVGYGTKKRSEILGSVATITGAELQDIPATNLAGAMRNKIAGVGVSQVSGRPGAPITLNIRNSTASSTASTQVETTAEPLYVVDGITVTREAFDNIDASMIENLTFLKDASAAIYGASGAKGVVLVTTKKGKLGKPSITYNGYLGVSDAAKTPDMLSGYDHAVLLNETYRAQSAPFSSLFLPADLDYIKNLNYKSWYDEVWQSATTQRHNLGISGGTEKITFFAGGSYQSENANYAGLKFDKYAFRSGVVANIANGLTADVNFNVDWNIRNAQHNQTDNDAAFFEQIVSVPRWVPISIDGKNVNFNNGAAVNPQAILESGYYDRRQSKGYRVNGSLSYQPTFLKGFTAKLQVSQSSGSTNSRLYQPPYSTYNFLRTGSNGQLYSEQLQLNPTTGAPVMFDARTAQNASVTPSLSDNNSYQGFLTLQYAKQIDKHSFGLLAGAEQSESNGETVAVRYTNQLIPGGEEYWAFDATSLARQEFSKVATSKRSFFGRINYDFDKKYLLEVITRVDASSNFASGNRWGVAPSVGLGWVASQEKFFKETNWLSFVNFLKLKVNVGVTGDDRVSQRLWQDRFLIDVTNGYLYGSSNQNSLNRSRLANPDITWEKKRTINVGLESSMFNSKLDFSVEVFQNYTYNQFDLGANQLYPLYAGFAAPVVNYRQLYNWGSEFSIGYKAKLATDLNLSTSINFAYGSSIVDRTIYAPGSLINNVAPDWLTSFGTDPNYYNSNNIGLRTIGMFRTQGEVDQWLAKYPNYRVYDRVPQPGWLYYEDTNEDGIINDYDMKPLYNTTNSFFSSGISLNLTYKAFALNTNINARFGGKVFYDSRARIAPSATRNILSIWNDRWTPENPMDGKFPRFDDPSLTRNSDFWAVDGTTIRINSMTLSYKAPTFLTTKLGLGGARIMLTGNNLWTLVNPLKYKDPYTSSAYDYPILRTISLGLNVNL